MLPSSGFAARKVGATVTNFPLPVPYRARYYGEGQAPAPAAPGLSIAGPVPRVVRYGDAVARSIAGLTAAGEPTSYVEIEQTGVFSAALVDQFTLGRFGSPCDLELIIFARDGSELLVVGNSPFHDFPYLDLERDFESTAVDFATGKVRVGQFNAKILDKRRVANDQRTGIVTDAISRAGQDGLSGLRYELRRFIHGVGWVAVITGVVFRYYLNPSAVSYTFELRDEHQKTKSSRAFVRSNATLIPGGPADPWGHGTATDGNGYPSHPIPAAHAIWPNGAYAEPDFEDGAGIYFNQYWSKGRFDSTSVVPDWLIVTDEVREAGVGEFMFTHTPATGSPIHFWRFPKLQLEWSRPTETTFRRNPIPVQGSSSWAPDGPAPNWWDNFDQVRKARDSENREVDAIARFYVTPRGMDDVSSIPELTQSDVGWGDSGYDPAIDNNTRPKARILYRGETSKKFPFFVDRPAADFVRSYLDGEYGGFEDPVRYNEAAIATIPGRAFFFLTAPVDDATDWLARNVWAPLGLAPTLDPSGALSPVSNALPADPATAPALDSTNSQFPGSWAQGSGSIVNTVVFKYRRLYRNPEEPYSVGTREVTVKLSNGPSVEKLGELKQEFDTVVFSAHGWATDAGTTGGGKPGDNIFPLEDETGHVMANERYAVVRRRYTVGPQVVALSVLRRAYPELAAGEWFRVGHEWFPNLSTGLRGSAALGQVVSVADENCAFWRVELEAIEVGGMATPTASGVVVEPPTVFNGTVTARWTLTDAQGAQVWFAETPYGVAATDADFVYGGDDTEALSALYGPSKPGDYRVTVRVKPWLLLPSGGTANVAGDTVEAFLDYGPVEEPAVATLVDETDSGNCANSTDAYSATKRVRWTYSGPTNLNAHTARYTDGDGIVWSTPVAGTGGVYEEVMQGMTNDGSGATASGEATVEIIRDSDGVIVSTMTIPTYWYWKPCQYLPL